MPPPPLKMLRPVSAEKDLQIEALLAECGYLETLEVYKAERNKRTRLSSEPSENINVIEKRGDGWFCLFCEKTFTTKGSAKRHLVSTHSTDSKQFECPMCSSKFARRDDLYTHLRRMHDAAELVESMIEEHKAELKGEHKGLGLGQLINIVSHNEHLDVVLPSGNTICRPFSTDVSSVAAREPARAAKACRTSKCNHWRVTHDDHEDVLVNGALHHKNEDGEWECHGEIGSLEDFEFLLKTTQSVECQDTPLVQLSGHRDQEHHLHDHNHVHHDSAHPSSPSSNGFLGHHPQGRQDPTDLSLDDLDFFFLGGIEPGSIDALVTFKSSTESLLLPGGSVFCRRINPSTPKFHCLTSDEHKHSATCGHSRVRHGNHYDYVVGNVVESDRAECPMNGAIMLEQNDSSSLAHVLSALASDQVEQSSIGDGTSNSSGIKQGLTE